MHELKHEFIMPERHAPWQTMSTGKCTLPASAFDQSLEDVKLRGIVTRSNLEVKRMKFKLHMLWSAR